MDDFYIVPRHVKSKPYLQFFNKLTLKRPSDVCNDNENDFKNKCEKFEFIVGVSLSQSNILLGILER